MTNGAEHQGAILSIQNGAHAGGEIAVADGEKISIGSAEADDVCLADPNIAESHLTITVSGKRVELVCSKPTFAGLDDQPLESQRTWDIGIEELVGAPLGLRIGETRLLLCACGHASETSATHQRESFVPNRFFLQAFSNRRNAVGLASCLLAVTVLAGLLYVFGDTGRVEGISGRASTTGDIENLEKKLQNRSDWQQVKVRRSADGKIELSGSVRTRDSLNQLLKGMDLAAQDPKVKVVVANDLVSHIKEFLQDEAIEVSYLDAAGPDLPKVLVQGQTSKPQLRQSLNLLTVELEGRVEIVNQTTYAPKDGDRKRFLVQLPIKIAAVNSAEKYVESSLGAKYFEGSAISKDCIVESISSDVVVFNLGGKRLDFPLQ